MFEIWVIYIYVTLNILNFKCQHKISSNLGTSISVDKIFRTEPLGFTSIETKTNCEKKKDALYEYFSFDIQSFSVKNAIGKTKLWMKEKKLKIFKRFFSFFFKITFIFFYVTHKTFMKFYE